MGSECQQILVDARLAASPAELDALLAALRAARPDCRLLLFESPPDAAAEAAGTEALAGGETDGGLAELDRAREGGRLAGTLVLSDRERVLAWARRVGLPAFTSVPGLPVAAQLSRSALVLRDTVSALLHVRRLREGRPFLVGINGIDKAGKTSFAAALAERLAGFGLPVTQVALAEFTADKKERRAKGYPEAEGLYRKHYAMERLREQLLTPLRQARELPLELQVDVHDLARDRSGGKRRLLLERGAIVILEGPFLFQAEYFGLYDFRLYLVSDFERALELALAGLSGKAREQRQQEFQRRELAAQSLYLKQETPWKRAHLVLRGINTGLPRLEEANIEGAIAAQRSVDDA
jgi:uridine kinase